MKEMSVTEWISVFLPCYRWVRSYNFHDYLQCDLMAGITVGVMVVPQVIFFRFPNFIFLIFLFFLFLFELLFLVIATIGRA